MNYHLQEIGFMKGNGKEHIRITWNQSEAVRKNTSRMKWSLSWQAGEYIKAILANFKKPTLSTRGENIASDSMLALLDFCEDAMTPFVGFLKNYLGMKKASLGKHCMLDHQWEQMECEMPYSLLYWEFICTNCGLIFVFWFWVKIHLNTTFQQWQSISYSVKKKHPYKTNTTNQFKINPYMLVRLWNSGREAMVKTYRLR